MTTKPRLTVHYRSRKPLLGRRQWYWTIVSRNGRKIATGGEGYTNLADAKAAVLNVRLHLPAAGEDVADFAAK